MRFIPAIACCCLLLLLWGGGCKKPEDIGVTILPSFDLLKTPFSDTATIQCVTLLEDSLRANGLSKVLLGSYVEPDFGLSQASIYSQVLLGNIPSLGSNLTADSLVLSLAYAGYYGDTTIQQTVHLFEITDNTISADSTYHTNKTFDCGTTDIAPPLLFSPRPTDSVMVGTANQPAQLRIPLNTALADSFLSILQQSQYQNNTGWLSYFKGVYIKTDSTSGGAILYFNPSSAYSKMSLYYHDSSNASHSYDLVLNGANINHETHNYNYPTISSVAQVLADSSNLANNDTLSYLQSMAGLKVKLKFPYLKHFNDSGKIVINKAELVLNVAPISDTGKFAPPTNLLLAAFDSTGAIMFVADYYESNFGGYYNSSNSTYTFNIARQLQQILDGKVVDYGLSLNVLSSGVQANRVIIGSGKSMGSRMKLRLFYTRLPQSIKPKPTNTLKLQTSKPKM